MGNIFDLFRKIEKPKASPLPITHIVVGLGNPGEKYADTRHNTGFMALDYIAVKLSVKTDRLKFKSLCGECVINGARTLLMKPQTFMNNSGEAVRDAADFYKIPAENIIVIFDDVNFDVGHMRIRRSGSDGGHNGMKSIIFQLNSDAFARVRLGIGKKPNPEYDLADWVLGRFSDDDKKDLFSCFEKVYNSIVLIQDGKIDDAMSLYNK